MHLPVQDREEQTLAAKGSKQQRAEPYVHEDEALLRPDIGTQAQFKKKKPPKTYRYDSSLSPALDWDGQNPARARGVTSSPRSSGRLPNPASEIGVVSTAL